MKFVYLSFALLLSLQMNAQTSKNNLRSIYFDDLLNEINNKNDTIWVVNFWATWCSPCVAELPVFESAKVKYESKKVKILLVNLDFNSKVDSDVIPFIKRKGLQSEIVHLLNTDPNAWINRIDSIWSGAIPATFIFRKRIRAFSKEGSVTSVELTGKIDEMLNDK